MLAAEAKRSWSEARRLVKAEAVRVAPPVEAREAAANGAAGAGTAAPAEAGARAVPERAAASTGDGVARRRWRARGPLRWRGARAWARAVLERARQQARALEEAAREQGFRAGYEAGRQEGRQEAAREVAARLAELVRQAEAMVEEARQRRDRALAMAEEDVVKLALAVAERVVRREVASGPEVTAEVLRSVLREMPAAAGGRVVVRLHPDEHRLLAEAWGGAVPGQGGGLQVEWRADPAVERGGCVVETEMGTIDAGLETRLAEVAAGLLDVMRGGR